MAHAPINRSAVPVRLFKSDALERLTHVHPAVVPIVWLPVAAYFLSRPLVARTLDPASIALAVVLGALVWTFAEYNIHRYAFHFEPKNPTLLVERALFLMHGVHHVQPQCKTRLVMPPVVSVPLALVFYGLFTLLVGRLLGAPDWVAPTFGAFVVGYVAYDMIHYATHHLPVRRGPLKALRRHHMLHHFRTPNRRFGVSSPLWDAVYGTLPDRGPAPDTAT